MPNSKVDERYDFNPDKWVISLINTKGGTGGIMAGHAKIIVEGQRHRAQVGHFQPAPELCIAEFHIYDEGGAIAASDSWVPQFLRNTQSTYAVLTSTRYEIKMLETAAWEAIVTPEVKVSILTRAKFAWRWNAVKTLPVVLAISPIVLYAVYVLLKRAKETFGFNFVSQLKKESDNNPVMVMSAYTTQYFIVES